MADLAADKGTEAAASSAGGRKADRAHSARMLLVIGALAAGFAFVPRLTQGCAKAEATEEAADFSAPVIANPQEPSQTSIKMSALRGHPVLIDFWATWCRPCQAEAPIVNGVAQRFKDRGLVVLGINTSDPSGLELAPAFAAKKGLTFPILFDDGEVARSYQAENLPTLIFISKEGKIVARRQGITSEAELERIIRQIL